MVRLRRREEAGQHRRREIQKIVVAAAPLAWTHEINYATVLDRRYRDVIVSPLGLFGSFDRAWRE